MSSKAAPSSLISARELASGAGWRVVDVVCRSGPQDGPGEEQHASTSVAAVLSGRFLYRSSGGTELMTAGSVLLGNAGAAYCCGHDHSTGDRCLSFQFAPTFMEEARRAAAPASPAFTSHRIAPTHDLLPLFAAAGEVLRSADRLAAEETALRFAAAALAHEGRGSSPGASARDLRRTADALVILQERWREPISLDVLAAAAGVGRHHLLRTFRAVVGVTPYNYLLGRRLEAAAEQLAVTRRSVLEVALDVGFGDLSEFTRQFHRRFGRSPARFRTASASRNSALLSAAARKPRPAVGPQQSEPSS